ncbi:MAG TPA: hypothetical protein ENI51_10390 [Candidatus Atribacteria bacterium]|nr:hypothetical protein [Candidatus Atribacteria bacterium]
MRKPLHTWDELKMKITVTKNGARELKRLRFDAIQSIREILKYVPPNDLIGLSFISITDLPTRKLKKHEKIAAAYFKGKKGGGAFIEIYICRLFGHINNPENFRKLLPIQEYGLASTIFHEIGHHVREIRTHGVKKSIGEKFADRYAERILRDYIMDNAGKINQCFDFLETMFSKGNIDQKILESMKEGWEKTYKKALSSEIKAKQNNL